MSNANSSQGARKPFSLSRVLMILIPAAAIVVGFSIYKQKAFESETRLQGEELTLHSLGLDRPRKNILDKRFVDANSDLLADPPTDPAELIDPDPLVFSYVGGKDSEKQKEVWKGFLDALAAATGKKVEYLILNSPDEELIALKEGKLHVAAVNTGNVPAAVNQCGFIPAFTFGGKDKSFGYTVQIIVPAASKIKDVKGLRGKKIAFTDRMSNSGYKAPLVLLMHDYELVPERDFEFVFTYGHESSIKGAAEGKFDAAPVASDLLARAVAHGDIDKDAVRVIYESERFPQAALGYLYNLQPALVDKINETFASFDWKGSGLEAEFGATGETAFVPVDYKNEFALIRRIDDAIGMKSSVKD